jgi:hypothetical protein
MSEALPVDAVALRDEVRAKYRDVAVNPRLSDEQKKTADQLMVGPMGIRCMGMM